MNNNKTTQHSHLPGFTLVEVMIAAGLFGLITAGVLSVYIMCQGIWHSTTLKMDATRSASMAIARLVYGPGDHDGLRSASRIVVDSGYAGVYHPWTPPTNYPPPANALNHWIAPYSPSDGSWRMTVSNINGQTTWIDYNINARNLVFWPTTNPSSRELICNHVISATASTTVDGVSIALTVSQNEGKFSATNHASTFVNLRNQ